MSCSLRQSLTAALRLSMTARQPSKQLSQAAAYATQQQSEWHWMKEKGIEINPCNSRLHPAVLAGALEIAEENRELPVQEAYTPNSMCFGCGPAAQSGLKLQSFRAENGLAAKATLSNDYQAFPGITNGGIVSTLFDCHGNWTAAITLMDRRKLPRPPLTLTAELLVQYLQPTPPQQQLLITSEVVSLDETGKESGKKDSVTVTMALMQVLSDGNSKVLAKATGLFKKLGALRAI